MKWLGTVDFDGRPKYDTVGLVTSAEVDTVSGTLQTSIDGAVSNVVYSSDWDEITDTSPSKNTVYDEMETRMVVGSNIDGGSF